MTPGISMSRQQARELIKEIVQAKDKAELQTIIGQNISRCNGVFFAELGDWLLVIGYWGLVIGDWRLEIGDWQFVSL